MKTACLLLAGSLVAAVGAQAQTQATEPQPAGWEASVKTVTEACKGETPQLCPGMTTETAIACLQSNIDKLTPECKSAVTQAAKAALGGFMK